MLYIPCPWCGPREETEFSYGGEAGVRHPSEAEELGDREWGNYLFVRQNPAGRWRELWYHAAGCRRWFELERDTVSQELTVVDEPDLVDDSVEVLAND